MTSVLVQLSAHLARAPTSWTMLELPTFVPRAALRPDLATLMSIHRHAWSIVHLNSMATPIQEHASDVQPAVPLAFTQELLVPLALLQLQSLTRLQDPQTYNVSPPAQLDSPPIKLVHLSA